MTSRKNIVVYGFARSGTTWITEVIAGNSLKIIFEPMHPQKALGLNSNYPYEFLANSSKSKYQELYLKAFSGEIQNDWTLRGNKGSDRFILKEIRANLMIGWIENNFDFYSLFIIRNPLAAVASNLKKGWFDNISSFSQTVEVSPQLLKLLGKYAKYIYDAKNKVELAALSWCIDNKVPQLQGYFDKLFLIRYERLLRNPREEFEKIFNYVRVPVYPEIDGFISKRSFTSDKSTLHQTYDFENSWRGYLSKNDEESVTRMVENFELGEFL